MATGTDPAPAKPRVDAPGDSPRVFPRMNRRGLSWVDLEPTRREEYGIFRRGASRLSVFSGSPTRSAPLREVDS